MALVISYVAAFVLPLSDRLTGVRNLSPWYWALGPQPVTDGVAGPSLLLVGLVTAVFVVAGTAAVSRRDVKAP